MTGIGQLQTLAHLFQPDAASTLVCHAFGMIAVGYFAMYLSGAFTEVDTDKAGFGGGDAMLEEMCIRDRNKMIFVFILF